MKKGILKYWILLIPTSFLCLFLFGGEYVLNKLDKRPVVYYRKKTSTNRNVTEFTYKDHIYIGIGRNTHSGQPFTHAGHCPCNNK